MSFIAFVKMFWWAWALVASALIATAVIEKCPDEQQLDKGKEGN